MSQTDELREALECVKVHNDRLRPGFSGGTDEFVAEQLLKLSQRIDALEGRTPMLKAEFIAERDITR